MKKRKTIFINHEWMYALTQGADGRLYIEVMVGGFAMERYIIPLTEDEQQRYSDEGKDFLHRFAINISKDPQQFANRRIL